MTNEEHIVVDDWACPPEDRHAEKNGRRLVVECIKQKGISYPSEITMITGLSRQSVFDYLSKLHYTKQLIKIDIATCRNPPPMLKRRLPELWAMGLKGNALKRMSWYMLASSPTVDTDFLDPLKQTPLVKLDQADPENKPIDDIDKAIEQVKENQKHVKKER